MSHTKGPWYVEGSETDPWICAGDANGSDYRIIAQIYDRPYPEMKADFDLIAAAPDLLEALERLIGYAQDFAQTDAAERMDEADDGTPNGEYAKELRGYIQQGLEALARAKGQTA